MVSRFSTNGEATVFCSLGAGDAMAKSIVLQPVRANKPNTKQSEVTRFMFSSLLEVGLEVLHPLIRHQLEKLESF
jgi:hypothetical protein